MAEDAKNALPTTTDLGELVESLSSIGGDLLVSYGRLEKRAERMEQELCTANAEVAELTERMHQMDKMAALGTMAAGIAHEIRNPMNAVKGFADLFRKNLEPGTRDHRWATLISSGVAEVDGIITSLLTFSQPEKLLLEEIDPEQLLEDTLSVVLQLTPGERDPSNWKITTRTEAQAFQGDRIKLRQALRNLISNSLDVQPTGGEIQVEIVQEDESIVFRVSDAGPGIPEEMRNRVTDPFFTTRAEGTGLGLSLVHTIVRLHGGTFEVLPEPSVLGGAQIQFQVPVTPRR